MKIKFLKDEPKSDAEIDAASKLVANETDSVAMATMLGKMWKEMRMFEVPSFTRDVQEDIRHLKHEEKKLDEELDAAQAKLSTARSMWAKGGKAQEEEKEDVKKEAALKKKAAIKDDEKDDEDAVPAKIEKSSKASAPKPNKNVEKAVDTSLEASVLHRWSFWHMDSKQQHAVLTSSLVYLVFGVLIAFVYLQCRNKYASSSFFKPKPQRSIIGDKKEFSAPLFGCLGDPSICLVGLLCPCIRWADTIQQTKLSSYWKAFFIMFFLMLLHPYTLACSSICIFIIGAHYRQKLREKYGIEHGSKWSMFTDLAAWMCCQCCAIVQEAREEAFSKDKDIDGQSMA
jgi:Cys-rich protein (TIGR01571 family)